MTIAIQRIFLWPIAFNIALVFFAVANADAVFVAERNRDAKIMSIDRKAGSQTNPFSEGV
jgi:predicted membrane protein